MYKCIYNITTQRVVAICNPNQNLESLMSNWTNVDFIAVDSLNGYDKEFNIYINLTTKQLEKRA